MATTASDPIVILSYARTPMGSFQGALAGVTATELGATAVKAAIERAGITGEQVDKVFMGNVLSAGLGQAPARQAAIHGGIPPTVSAVTINKVCGSGLKAVMLAAQALRAGDGSLFVAGGMESMSNAPYLLRGMRQGVKLGDQEIVDGVIHDGLWCSFGECHMGGHAEYTADRAGISREEADRYAVESHRKAAAAQGAGKFADEIVAIVDGNRRIEKDGGVRADASVEAMAKLEPAFDKEGSVTAATSSPLTDGAAAVLVCSEDYAKAHGLKPLARIRAIGRWVVCGMPVGDT